jgi:UDPglucose 6-dehydrogenase
MIQIGIIGGGFVGTATSLLSQNNNKINSIIYDIDPNRCSPLSTTFEDILQTNAVFICVWTPMITNAKEFGKCDTSIVESIINQLKNANYKGYIVVRSTVPVGFCRSNSVYFMPEFLTEANWKNDFLNCEKWIFGLNMENYSNEDLDKNNAKFQEFATNLIFSSNVINKNIAFVDSDPAEYLKYFRNCFLALKVSFCNEMFQFAQSKSIDYDDIIDLITDDKRIGSSHTLVPGPDGLRGFGGNCFLKDMASLEYQMNQKNVRSDIISAAIKRNNEIDRSKIDWMK